MHPPPSAHWRLSASKSNMCGIWACYWSTLVLRENNADCAISLKCFLHVQQSITHRRIFIKVQLWLIIHRFTGISCLVHYAWAIPHRTTKHSRHLYFLLLHYVHTNIKPFPVKHAALSLNVPEFFITALCCYVLNNNLNKTDPPPE